MPYGLSAPTTLTPKGNFKGQSAYINTLPVTPSDTLDLPNGPTQLLIAVTAGNIAVNLFGGGTATLTGLAAGQMLPIEVSRVLATGTTATVGAGYN